MPCFRGLDVSIVTLPSAKKLPEFPHSDASSVRILPPTRCTSSSWESEAGGSNVDSSRIQKVNPLVSVYIPSAPGSQFGVHYSINRIPEPPCQLYFKIFLNGRSIASWGINPVVQSSGSVTRALFEPDDRWHYKEDGVLHRREGIEARCFYFLPNSSRASVAEDGGLIEVQVFRSKGRKRRAPVLGQHRGQESYGIASPSGGLLESPEDAYYYDWLLIDPKEFPFVSFRFHYRSWTNLRQLSLVPARAIVNGSDTDDDHVKSLNNTPVSSREEHTENSGSALALGGNTLEYKNEEDLVARLLSLLQLPAPTHLPSLKTKTIIKSLPHASTYRPLPEIPEVGAASRKSYESYTPSIAPSLLPYIEEESMEAEEAEFGMATQIPIRSNSLVGGKSQTSKSREHQSKYYNPASSPCSWPLGDDSRDGELAVHVSRSQHPSLATGALEKRECRIYEDATVDETLVAVETALPSQISLWLNEGEWMKGSPPKLSQAVLASSAHGVKNPSVKSTRAINHPDIDDISNTKNAQERKAGQALTRRLSRGDGSLGLEERRLADWI
ncbi:hypothetical protein BKA56DRAFT_675554 [Ilyonectria sp. MPI-CAGE-AT-0026]|nr:hypothetical protein BKA56DRAFT_675554 [Ilyonectria sp. MPI-CAGE-AT-0026]